MAVYYVHASGTSGTGTSLSPYNMSQFATILNSSASPADEYVCKDGTYLLASLNPVNQAFRVNRSGTAGNLITIRAENALQAVFQGPTLGSLLGSAIYNGFRLLGSFIKLQDLDIYGVPFNGVYVSGPDCHVVDCRVRYCGLSRSNDHFGGEGILVGGLAHRANIDGNTCTHNKEKGIYIANGPDNGTCTDNTCSYNGYDVNGGLSNSFGSCGLQVNAIGGTSGTAGSSGWTISGNKVHHNSLRGILLLQLVNSTLDSNIVYGNGGAQVQFSRGSSGNTFSNNQVASNTRHCVAMENSGRQGDSNDNAMTGNILYCVGSAVPNVPFYYQSDDQLSSSSNNVFRAPAGIAAQKSSTSISFATYQSTFGDSGSTFATSGTPGGLHADISTWLGNPDSGEGEDEDDPVDPIGQEDPGPRWRIRVEAI